MAPPKRPELYELDSLLYEIDYEGYVVLHRDKLLRLLGRGNEAAGTWAALIEMWEGIDGSAAELRMVRLPGNRFLFTNQALTRVKDMANK